MIDLLIVDDSAAIRKILQRVLRQADVPLGEVYEAADGLEALQVVETQKVSLILADINMPNMDGLHSCASSRRTAGGRVCPSLW